MGVAPGQAGARWRGRGGEAEGSRGGRGLEWGRTPAESEWRSRVRRERKRIGERTKSGLGRRGARAGGRGAGEGWGGGGKSGLSVRGGFRAGGDARG